MSGATPQLDDPRDRLEQVTRLVAGTGQVSRFVLQRNFRITQGAAVELMHLLYDEGLISAPDPVTGLCRVLVRRAGGGA